MEIEMFIWEWQHVFQGKVLQIFQGLLKDLDIKTDVNVFILGIPISNNINDVCFQPEYCGFTLSELQNIFLIAKENFDTDPGQNIFMTGRHLYEAHRESLYPKALKKAVESILKDYEITKSLIYFCSYPVQINQHWVMTIVQCDKTYFDSLYKLRKEVYEMDEFHKYKIHRCFLEAVIEGVLSESYHALITPTKIGNYSFSSTERILEDAASSLLSSITVHVNDWGGDLFELLNLISAEPYEGAVSKGRLLICNQENPNISVKVKLKKSIKIAKSEYRGIRKLLEVSSDAMALLCDGACVWGLGSPLQIYDPLSENVFEIRFTGNYAWELVHAENIMLTVKYRKPNLPREKFNKVQFHDHINLIFNADSLSENLLVEAVEAAVDQSHGTMLIISANAELESERLSAQSTKIEVIPISKDIVSHVSSVDGAIIVSPNGNIYSFGVILDGLATKNGKSSRGARYNSAIRYIDGQNKINVPCLAIIVSEDGYVEIYPTLNPRISRSIINKLLDELEQYSLSSNLHNESEADKAWKNLYKLKKLEFYLLEKDIERVNEIKDIVIKIAHVLSMKNMSRTGLGFMIPSMEDFVVNEKMRTDYYI
jgi:DisA bacterial checkpoint controller nucleotide-binding